MENPLEKPYGNGDLMVINGDEWILMSGWWFQRFVMLFSVINIWDVNLPMDEVHHFSRWLPSGKLT